MKLTHFSLFTGIGGIDLAAEWAGFETVGQVEFADYPTKVLEKHWPDVERWRDVRDVTIKSIRERGIENITLLSGGFPCQPHSLAGKRRASDDERDLWGEFARLISEIRPRWVLGENVPGLLTSEDGRFFGRVLNDLAKVGYNVGWCCYGAKDVGAWHKRERVFIIAYSKSQQSTADIEREISEKEQREFGRVGGKTNILSNTTSKRLQGQREFIESFYTKEGETWEASKSVNVCIDREWKIEPGVGRVANGIPEAMDRLQCLGNAVVPQQAYPILKMIADIERGI